jgi:hypothetical protein
MLKALGKCYLKEGLNMAQTIHNLLPFFSGCPAFVLFGSFFPSVFFALESYVGNTVLFIAL